MAAVDRTIKLPNGNVITARVPEEWGADQVRSALESKGVDFTKPVAPGDEPSVTDKLLYGAAKVTPLVGVAANLIEQKVNQRPDEVVTKTVSTTDLPPTIDPVTGEADFGPQETITETVKGVTSEDIRKEQDARKDMALGLDFPNVHGTKYADDTAVKVGEVARYMTDLITVPMPTAKAGELFNLVKSGETVMGSTAGRAMLGKAAAEGALGASVFGASDNVLRQMADKGEIDMKELGTVALIAGAGGAGLAPLIATTGGRIAKWAHNRSQIKAKVLADEVNAVAENKLTRQEAEQIAEAMNKVSDRATVEAATLDALYPVKTARSITPDPKAKPVAPEVDTRGEGTQYHGTADEIIDLGEGHYSNANYYGNGFYSTDAQDIGVGYMKARKGRSPTLYRVEELRPVKMLDLEKPLPPDVRRVARRAIADHVDEGFDFDARSGREVLDEIRDVSSEIGMSRDTVQDIFESVQRAAERAGFSGWSHTGGIRTGQKPHHVKIYFNPKTDVKLTKVQPRAAAAPALPGPAPYKAPKLTKAERDLRKDIRAAFEAEAETADALRNHAEIIRMQREAFRALPLEVQRARGAVERHTGALPKRDQSIDRIAEQRIRARQEAELARLEAERTTPSTQPVRERAKAAEARHQQEVVGRSKEQYRTKQDRIPKTQTLAQKTGKRMEQIAPRIALAVRRATVMANRATNTAVKRILPWANDKAMRKMTRTNPVYRAAVLNRNVDEMNRILPGSGDRYRDTVIPLMDEYAALMKQDGLPIIADGIHPRAVHNVERLRKTLGREGNEKLDDLLIQTAKKHGKPVEQLNEHEIAGVIGQIASGHKHKEYRGRTIVEVTPEAAKWYADPVDTLLDYIHRVEEDKAVKAFFADTLKQDVKIGAALTKEQLENSLGHVLAKGLQEGDLNTKDVQDLAELLDVHYGVSRGGPSKFHRTVKDIFTAMTLGYNPFSTLTQLADVGIIAAKTGGLNMIAGLRGTYGKDAAALYEAGLRNLASELRTNAGVARFTKRSLEDFGFSKLDKLGNLTAMNAVVRQRTAQAIGKPGKLQKELEPLFGAADTLRIIDDLKAGRYSDDVATLVAHDIASIRPISREDMPLGWNKDPHGRLKYSLLSWSINQMNFARDRYVKHFDNAVRLAARGKGKEAAIQMGKFATGFATLTTWFALSNVPPGVIKDMIRGEPIDPVKYAVQGAIPFGMSTKFAADILGSGRPEALVGRMVPFYGIALQGLGSVWRAGTQGDWAAIGNLSPTIRSLGQLMTGLGIITIKDADAAYALPEGYSAKLGAEALAPEPVRAENNLPAGWSPLAEPSAAEYAGMNATPAAEVPPAAPAEPPPMPTARKWTPPIAEPASDKLSDQFAAAKELLKIREGFDAKVYQNEIDDGKGGKKLDKPTAGHGHVLTAKELKAHPVGSTVDKKTTDAWFKKDVAKAFAAAQRQAKEIGRPDMVSRLTSVNFQLGTDWTSEHPSTWEFMKQGDWTSAAAEAADSLWYGQTPDRVEDLQKALLKGIKG